MPIVRVVLRSGALVREVTDGDAKFRCDVLIKFVRGGRDVPLQLG